jgi:hypothetical protein
MIDIAAQYVTHPRRIATPGIPRHNKTTTKEDA